MADWLAGMWSGQTVICAASGPSVAGVDLGWLQDAFALPVIVCNDTWRLAPRAAMLVAMDTAWWRAKGTEAAEGFAGLRVGWTPAAIKFGATHTAFGVQMHNFGNTGCAAVSVAVRAKARRVLLIGYDARPGDDGALHWHGAHPAPLKNPEASLARWPAQFERLADHARRHKVDVVNCTARSALTCFRHSTLEEELRTDISGFSTSEVSGTRMPAAPPSSLGTSPSPYRGGAT